MGSTPTRHLLQTHVRIEVWEWIRYDAERNGLSVAAWLRSQIEALYERAQQNGRT